MSWYESNERYDRYAYTESLNAYTESLNHYAYTESLHLLLLRILLLSSKDVLKRRFPTRPLCLYTVNITASGLSWPSKYATGAEV